MRPSLAIVPSALTNSVSRCPCCGAEVDKSRLLIDLNSNFAVINGLPVHLWPMECVVLYSLNEAYPRAVSRDRLIAACYGQREPKDAVNSINVVLCRLRDSLRPHRVSIMSQNKTYRLVLPV